MPLPFPFPPSPAPGSNGIGLFAIGISPIGTIPPFDYLRTIISQYANSPVLFQLIENFDSYLDQTANFDAFYDFIWNVDTAQGYGLDVWGRIVGVSRTLEIAAQDYLGFEEAGVPAQPYNQAPWFTGTLVTNNYDLSDNAYRTLILAKALANICDGSIPAINQLLLNMFPGRGNVYVTDGGNMTMTYTFTFQPTAIESAIINQSGVLPTPTGVSSTVVVI